MRGMDKDVKWVIKNIKDPEALDVALTSAAQYVEHYEIAGYGTLCEWARMLEEQEALELLEMTLEEEKGADGKLNDFASSKVNSMFASQLAH
jgi:ferritin-like metal-binding protein YciE